jgi:hypothetical protein
MPLGVEHMNTDMRMSLFSCWCDPNLVAYGLVLTVLLFAPVGAFVLRRQIRAATGVWKLLGRGLQLVGLITAPLAVWVLTLLIQV